MLPPRAPLRESNDGASVPKVSTPGRPKPLCKAKNRRDEVRSELFLYSVLLILLMGIIVLNITFKI